MEKLRAVEPKPERLTPWLWLEAVPEVLEPADEPLLPPPQNTERVELEERQLFRAVNGWPSAVR